MLLRKGIASSAVCTPCSIHHVRKAMSASCPLSRSAKACLSCAQVLSLVAHQINGTSWSLHVCAPSCLLSSVARYDMDRIILLTRAEAVLAAGSRARPSCAVCRLSLLALRRVLPPPPVLLCDRPGCWNRVASDAPSCRSSPILASDAPSRSGPFASEAPFASGAPL